MRCVVCGLPASDDSHANSPIPNPQPTQHVIKECGPTCACNEGCGLRKTARGLGVPVDVCWTGNRGFGVFARYPIREGTYIGTYMGEYLTQQEATERYDLVTALGGNPDYQGGLWFCAYVGGWIGGDGVLA